MSSSRRIAAVLYMSSAALSACGGGSATATPAATPTAAPGQEAYADSFKSAATGWPVEQKSDHTLGYGTAAGTPAYLVHTLTAGSSVQVSSPNNSLPRALTAEVTLTISANSGGPSSGDAGVGCDYDGSGYIFILQAGGAYAVEKVTAGVAGPTVASGAAGATAAIKAAQAPNLLSLTCVPTATGVTITAAVNGTQVAAATDANVQPATASTVQVWLRGDSNLDESDAAFSALRVIAR